MSNETLEEQIAAQADHDTVALVARAEALAARVRTLAVNSRGAIAEYDTLRETLKKRGAWGAYCKAHNLPTGHSGVDFANV
jgi:hypothetical protein